MPLSAAIRASDRRAAHAKTHRTRTGFVRALKMRFRGRNHRSTTSFSSDDDDAEELLVWDVQNPFAPPDPALAHVRALIQAEIARARRYESVGPLDSVHEAGHVDNADDNDQDSDVENADSDASDADVNAVDAEDDGDADDEDDDYDSAEDDADEDKLAPIALPRLLPIPLRFIPSPPPPTPIPSEEEEEDVPTPWGDLARAYNDIAEAEERARKAKRDAHRSRSKALAILGPEASVAL